MIGVAKVKKVLLIAIIIFLLIIGVYGYAWFEGYKNSQRFYQQANENYEKGEYNLALKGGEFFDSSTNKYGFIGGYEQVVNTWDNKWAKPKPSFYYDSMDKADDIIYNKLTADEGMAIFQKHFNISNKYLPEILLQTGKLYKENGYNEEAKLVFELVIDAFGMKEDIRDEAEKQLEELAND